jgi:hypothetical protein
MDYNINENWLVFVKIDKIGLNQFYRFTKNWSIWFDFKKNLEKFEKNQKPEKPYDKSEKSVSVYRFPFKI